MRKRIKGLLLGIYLWWSIIFRSLFKGVSNSWNTIIDSLGIEISKDKEIEIPIEVQFSMQFGRLSYHEMKRRLAVKGLEPDGLTSLGYELDDETKELYLKEADMILDDIQDMTEAYSNGRFHEFIHEKERIKEMVDFGSDDDGDYIKITNMDTGKTTKDYVSN